MNKRRIVATLTSLATVVGLVSMLAPNMALAIASPPSFVNMWGSYGSTPSSFISPQFVAADSAGNIFVADAGNQRIQEFDPSGAFILEWGSSGSGPGQFNNPQGIAVDSSGNIFVADSANNRVQKFVLGSPCPVGTTQIVTGVCYVSQWAVAGQPTGLAVDSSGNVYVTRYTAGVVNKYTNSGAPAVPATIGTNIGGGAYANQEGAFQAPTDVVVDASGNVYVADPNANKIQKFTSSGTPVGWLGACLSGTNCDVTNKKSLGFACTAATCTAAGYSALTGDGEFSFPWGIGMDSAGELYVADTQNQRIQNFASDGTFHTKWGSYGSLPGQFYNPLDVAVVGTTLLEIYVVDSINQRVEHFQATAATPSPTPPGPTPKPNDQACIADPGKICICHLPGGAANMSVIQVSLNALKAFLKNNPQDLAFDEETQTCLQEITPPPTVSASSGSSSGSLLALAAAALAAGLGVGIYARRRA